MSSASVEEARVTKAKSDIQAIETALTMFKLDNFKYPSTDLGLTALVQRPNDPTDPQLARRAATSSASSKDPWGNPYQYVFPGTRGQEYDLFSLGADARQAAKASMPTSATGTSIARSNACAPAARRRAGFTLHRDHDRRVHHRHRHGWRRHHLQRRRPRQQLEREASGSTRCSTTCASRPSCRPASTAFASTAVDYSFVVFDVLAESMAPRRGRRRAARAQISRGNRPPRWSSRAADRARDQEEATIEDFTPQIMIFSNGDLSSFEVFLRRDGGEDQARVYSDEQTNIRLLLPGEVEEKDPPVRAARRR